MLLLDLCVGETCLVDLSLQVLLLFQGALTSSPGDLPFHELNLVLSIVQQFLLPLKVLIKLIDV